jgi:NOL1/NOP2/fmu family ribosome biogenesis protein
MRFLNSKERKHFYKQLAAQYGYNGPREHALFEGGNDKLYAVTKEIDGVAFNEMNVVQGGLYVASTQGDDLRLTLDGAMLFAPYCNGCFVDVDEAGCDEWMRGENLSYNGGMRGYVLVRYKKRILGSGSVAAEGYIKNYVPKGRRISDPH